MQVLIPTGKAYGYSEADLRDPEKNLDAGLKNLKEALAYTNNNPKLAAVYYHSGPDAPY
jgi:soluble lytic murein transglycosylase-like protein